VVTVTTTFQSGIYTLGKRIVFFLLPEAFCGLKYADNSIAVAKFSKSGV